MGLLFGSWRALLCGSRVSAPTAPISPSNLTAATDWDNGGTVSLSWTDNSSDETAFAIFRSTDGSSYSEIDTVGAGVTSYQATGLTNDTLYYFKVAARNAIGDSSLTAAATATPRIHPDDVTGLVHYLWAENATLAALSEGANVETWPDESASGNDATKTVANRPTINKTGGPNSRPYVAFSGAWMEITPITNPRSVFIGYKDTSTAQYTTFWGGEPGGTSTKIFTGAANDSGLFSVGNTTTETLNGDNRKNEVDIGDGTASARPDAFGYYSFISSGSQGTRTIWTLGCDTIAGAPGTSRAIAGGVLYSLVYDNAVSSANATALNNRFMAYYGQI